MAATDARPIPIKNTAFRLSFEFRKNDGTIITSVTGADSEVSKDNAAFADCTNEFTETGTSGIGYLDLTSTEMNADSVIVKATCTNTDAVPTVVYLYPNETGDIDVDLTAVAGATTDVSALATNVAAILVDTGTTLDGKLDTIDTNVDSILDDTGTAGVVVASGSKTGYALSAAGIDAIWDEASSGHVSPGSFGARLLTTLSGTIGTGGNETTTVELPSSGRVATDDYYNYMMLYVVSGTGAGQGAIISDYVGSTGVATLSQTLQVALSTDSVVVVFPFGSIPGATAPDAATVAAAVWGDTRSSYTSAGTFGEVFQSFHNGATQAGSTSSSIVLASGASATTDKYKYQTVVNLTTGEARQITAYNGTTKVATVAPNWTTTPGTSDQYYITPLGLDAATVAQIADGVWDEARSGHVTAGSFGEYVLADVLRISGNATPADTLESILTGGGGTITANLAGTVSTVTTLTGHTPQTGDAFARLGAPVGVSISADLQTIDGVVDAILVDTADMQPKLGTPAADLSADIAAIKAQTAAIETDTQNIQSRLPAALTAGGNIKADIEEINGVTITGDGSGTPFDVA